MEETTILLADDSREDVQLTERIFKQLGLQNSLKIVRDGAEAIDYLSGLGKFADRTQFPFPSLLILDMAMPGKSGQEVLEWLKGRPELERLFVAILTGASRRYRSNKLFERHGNIVFLNDELLKPATVESIEGVVSLFRTWLGTMSSPR